MSEVKEIKPWPTYTEIRSKDAVWTEHRSEEYWEYRKKWSDIPKAMEVTEFPIHLDIETIGQNTQKIIL